MTSAKRAFPRIILFLIPTVFFFSLVHGNTETEVPASYHPLLLRLSQEGWDPQLLSSLFADPRAEFMPETVKISLGTRETMDLYARFLTPETIRLAREFLHQNLQLLKEAERNYQVDKEVIVAILLVESRFGENIGKRRIIPTLASMATMDSLENLQDNYVALREIDPLVSFEWVEGISKRRASWAYHELKCFLQIVRDGTIDPLEVRGSYAGAMGMAQFIPSSYLAYAVTKNGLDPWLLGREEAIFSIGNYLRNHGWKKSLSIHKKKRLLWTYNRSGPYVDAIMKIAERLKK